MSRNNRNYRSKGHKKGRPAYSQKSLEEDLRGRDNRPKIFNQEFRPKNKRFGTQVDVNAKDMRYQEQESFRILSSPIINVRSEAVAKVKAETKDEDKTETIVEIKTQSQHDVKSETIHEIRTEPKSNQEEGADGSTSEDSYEAKPCSPIPSEPMEWPMDWKHPLLHPWQLWLFKQPSEKSSRWEDGLIKVAKFDTVEDFWGLYNNIKEPSDLNMERNFCDYSLFKEHINPAWEDDNNINGGRWLCTLDKVDNKARNWSPSFRRQVDEVWLEMLMCLVGETFGKDGDHVCGVVLNVRKTMYKLSIWTGDWKAHEANKRIGQILMKRTGANDMKYESHYDNAKRTGSTVRPIWEMFWSGHKVVCKRG